MMCADEKDKCI